MNAGTYWTRYLSLHKPTLSVIRTLVGLKLGRISLPVVAEHEWVSTWYLGREVCLDADIEFGATCAAKMGKFPRARPYSCAY